MKSRWNGWIYYVAKQTQQTQQNQLNQQDMQNKQSKRETEIKQHEAYDRSNDQAAITYKQFDAPSGIITKAGAGLKYYIETWGCQMNEEDSEKLRSAFFAAYAEHFSGHSQFWRPRKKLITIDEVRLNR